jgi:hypothetical protein
MNTRKYPRTLTEAFGPYAGGRIEEQDPMPVADRIVVAASAAGAVAVLVMLAIGWIN